MIIIVYGKLKSGKTKLARILAGLTEANLVDLDDPTETDSILGDAAGTKQRLVVTYPVYKDDPAGDLWEAPRGSSFRMSIADIVIEVPSLRVVKDRRGILGVSKTDREGN